MINKKAQIGTTLTWFMAFILIFFIVILFTTISALMASKKQISIADIVNNKGENEISVSGKEYSYSDYALTRDLYTFLIKPVSKNGDLSVLASIENAYSTGNEEVFDNVREESSEYFDKMYGSCYYICIDVYDKENLEKNWKIKWDKCTFELSCSELLAGAGENEFSKTSFNFESDLKYKFYLYKENSGGGK